MTKIISIITDCDNTLAPDTTSMLLEDNGINLDSFWEDISSKVKLGWDPPIAWMTEIAEMIKNGKISQDTNARLAEFGKSVTPFPGTSEFIMQINESLGKEHDVTIEGYVVSCGIEPLMQGMILSESFTDIFGCSFYEKNGVISGVKSCITFTEKTKFIFAINKGITSQIRENPYNVNTFVENEKRRIPFENMIYLGDGASDIPCFSMIKQNGGHCIGIDIDSKWHKDFQLELRKREMNAFKPDYREGSGLRRAIEEIISN
jgi:2-hydroxy-3-keto-5-methylthiopentenyl-1-phosphate phosphatase